MTVCGKIMNFREKHKIFPLTLTSFVRAGTTLYKGFTKNLYIAYYMENMGCSITGCNYGQKLVIELTVRSPIFS